MERALATKSSSPVARRQKICSSWIEATAEARRVRNKATKARQAADFPYPIYVCQGRKGVNSSWRNSSPSNSIAKPQSSSISTQNSVGEVDAKTADSKVAGARAVDDKAAEARIAEASAAETKAAESNVAEAEAAKAKAVGVKVAEAQDAATEARAAEDKASEQKRQLGKTLGKSCCGRGRD